MPHIPSVAVLATQLAATDRRALSQAWYDTLHVAQGRERATPAPRTAPQGPAHAATRACPSRAERGSPRALVALPEPERSRVLPRGAAVDADRRAPKTELARQLERALARRIPRTAPVSFALRAADGRVHVVMRSDGARTRVVAVCAAGLRERVERALAHARFAIAAYGEAA